MDPSILPSLRPKFSIPVTKTLHHIDTGHTEGALSHDTNYCPRDSGRDGLKFRVSIENVVSGLPRVSDFIDDKDDTLERAPKVRETLRQRSRLVSRRIE